MPVSIGAPKHLSNKYFGFLQFLYISDTNTWKPRFF